MPRSGFLTLFIGLLLSPLSRAELALPPPQPLQGPGGSSYSHADVRQWHFNVGGNEYWVFTPDRPQPESAPLVVFTHGWSVMQPDLYRAWIEHIVRRGAILVYPRYQATLKTPAADFLPNAANAVRSAVTDLRAGKLGVRPELQHAAYLGHSAGGLIASGLAASWQRLEIPRPAALMAVEPGRSSGPRWREVPLEPLSGIPVGTLLLAVCGDEDERVACDDARRIYNESTQVAARDKDLLLLRSDRHGSPPLLANHAAPTAPRFDPRYPPSDSSSWLLNRVQERVRQRLKQGQPNIHNALATDAMDWFGTWKLFDALCDAAFYGQDRDYALGGTPAQLSMGRWNDGTPVKPIQRLSPH
ncbi:alpha/beta hydrolase fold domain-containing protein [Pseudomonas sp. ZM23]|uniref:Alpha/beta hydrolase fold domain-containing protein n=1 Tax=Pseudomonas triclosanedens TaxID=2961893 RepID=A0ABY6ZUK0_9PSED|nr:alpha/beta hydrolase fold domain-containing protein [Pseudomonas triclosanedens]MCP8466628.1 alpha/beta hydrolase fold domain-containing protein [Pseudomonas triclosanedens]MCP8472017.1 alpha/beta hydrolase fold domain-containing protein [Pseudomonas triclosanedens]MCP8474599.1 alpha/beta hydrolase fold domain-containing protein [Pseudomonas triclosanedens]WAI48026.1 alpha/beta hydrolase fold domain-containing protein [Pseudomonas triclosanedens]